jgi:L-malate glycosyltransferase
MTVGSRSVGVLQIVAAPTAGAEIGVNGPERRAANVVGKWAALGIEPVIAYPRRGRLWDTFAQAGVPLVDFEIGSKFDVRRMRELARLATAHRVDLIHTQGPGSLDAFAALAGRACGIPAVVTRPVMIEHLVNVSRLRRELYGRLDRVTLRLARRVIAVSDAGRRYLQTFGQVPPERLEVVYNGVDLGRFAPRSPRQNGSVTIGMVAQLTSAKGWEDFISVIEGLVARAGRVHAKVVGDGPLRGALETLVRERGLEAVVEFVGHRTDVERVLRELDVFVLSSHREGLSMAVLEAMASGLPVVATAVGGAREQVVDGVNGFVTRVGDVAGLVDRCAQLVASRELRERFGRASRQRAETHFSETAMVEGYAQAYRAALGDAFHHRRSA